MITLLLLIVWLAVFVLLHRRFPCDCGRSAPPYFYHRHEHRHLMLAEAVLVTGSFVSVLLAREWIAVLGGPVAFFAWVVWFKHESGRIKRAARSLGQRVIVTTHGRLRVVPE